MRKWHKIVILIALYFLHSHTHYLQFTPQRIHPTGHVQHWQAEIGAGRSSYTCVSCTLSGAEVGWCSRVKPTASQGCRNPVPAAIYWLLLPPPTGYGHLLALGCLAGRFGVIADLLPWGCGLWLAWTSLLHLGIHRLRPSPFLGLCWDGRPLPGSAA